MFGVGVVEVAVFSVGVGCQDIAPYLGLFVPVGVGDVGLGELDVAVVEFFGESQMYEGVVVSVVVVAASFFDAAQVGLGFRQCGVKRDLACRPNH